MRKGASYSVAAICAFSADSGDGLTTPSNAASFTSVERRIGAAARQASKEVVDASWLQKADRHQTIEGGGSEKENCLSCNRRELKSCSRM